MNISFLSLLEADILEERRDKNIWLAILLDEVHLAIVVDDIHLDGTDLCLIEDELVQVLRLRSVYIVSDDLMRQQGGEKLLLIVEDQSAKTHVDVARARHFRWLELWFGRWKSCPLEAGFRNFRRATGMLPARGGLHVDK